MGTPLARDRDPWIALLVGLAVVQVVVVEILIQAGSLSAGFGTQTLVVTLAATIAAILGLGMRGARSPAPSV